MGWGRGNGRATGGPYRLPLTLEIHRKEPIPISKASWDPSCRVLCSPTFFVF